VNDGSQGSGAGVQGSRQPSSAKIVAGGFGPTPDPRTPNSVRSVLIVRLSALGDCIHALPAIRALRVARPDLRIGWAVDDRFAPLFQNHPDVDELHVLPRRGLAGRSLLARGAALRELGRQLRASGFEAAVDLQGLAKSALVTLASGAPLRIGLSASAGARELSWATYNCRPPVPASARHVAERSLALLAPLGIPAGAALPDPRLPARAQAAARVETALGEMGLSGRRFAVLNPGAGWETKLWPVGHYSELARLLRDQLALDVLVSWFGARERELAERIAAAGPARPAAATDLPELAELLRRAALYVGADTGPTHIAAAVGTPTVAIFGPADAVRNRPLGPRLEVLTAGLDCAPCWRRKGCRRAVECMTAVRPEQVLAAARRLLSASNPQPATRNRSLP
jgi:heptosyltransferase-1